MGEDPTGQDAEGGVLLAAVAHGGWWKNGDLGGRKSFETEGKNVTEASKRVYIGRVTVAFGSWAERTEESGFGPEN